MGRSHGADSGHQDGVVPRIRGGREPQRPGEIDGRHAAIVHALTYNQVVVNETDQLFGGLADPTRRDILRRCAIDAPSVTRLAEAYPMSFAAVQKHVAVLERAGLVVKERRGRETLVRTEPAAVRRARRTLDELEDLWQGRVARMTEVLTEEGNPR
jgi:DNA-binding transcriptional ArsR family regulator